MLKEEFEDTKGVIRICKSVYVLSTMMTDPMVIQSRMYRCNNISTTNVLVCFSSATNDEKKT